MKTITAHRPLLVWIGFLSLFYIATVSVFALAVSYFDNKVREQVGSNIDVWNESDKHPLSVGMDMFYRNRGRLKSSVENVIFLGASETNHGVSVKDYELAKATISVHSMALAGSFTERRVLHLEEMEELLGEDDLLAVTLAPVFSAYPRSEINPSDKKLKSEQIVKKYSYLILPMFYINRLIHKYARLGRVDRSERRKAKKPLCTSDNQYSIFKNTPVSDVKENVTRYVEAIAQVNHKKKIVVVFPTVSCVRNLDLYKQYKQQLLEEANRMGLLVLDHDNVYPDEMFLDEMHLLKNEIAETHTQLVLNTIYGDRFPLEYAK